MKKVWKAVCFAALVCLVMGVLLAGVGFFTGGSPVSILNHGSLDGFFKRLAMNRDILLETLRALLP